ncbi:hypothetical protein V8C86DRAFT_839174 [Haematococcus lacustris]
MLGPTPQSLAVALARFPGSCRSYLLQRLTVTSVCAAFYYYTNITTLMLTFFSCPTVDSPSSSTPYWELGLAQGRYWSADYSSKCYEGYHKWLVLTLGIPGLLLYSLGLPLLTALLLHWCRARLYQVGFRSLFSFLYQDYEEKYAYWESVVMLRKFLLVLVVVFLSSVSTDLQLLVALGTIIAALCLQLALQPYRLQRMNWLEQGSLCVNTWGLYTGLYLISEATVPRVLLGQVMVILNSITLLALVLQVMREYLAGVMRDIDLDEDGVMSDKDLARFRRRCQRRRERFNKLLAAVVAGLASWARGSRIAAMLLPYHTDATLLHAMRGGWTPGLLQPGVTPAQYAHAAKLLSDAHAKTDSILSCASAYTSRQKADEAAKLCEPLPAHQISRLALTLRSCLNLLTRSPPLDGAAAVRCEPDAGTPVDSGTTTKAGTGWAHVRQDSGDPAVKPRRSSCSLCKVHPVWPGIAPPVIPGASGAVPVAEDQGHEALDKGVQGPHGAVHLSWPPAPRHHTQLLSPLPLSGHDGGEGMRVSGPCSSSFSFFPPPGPTIALAAARPSSSHVSSRTKAVDTPSPSLSSGSPSSASSSRAQATLAAPPAAPGSHSAPLVGSPPPSPLPELRGRLDLTLPGALTRLPAPPPG